MTVIKVVDDQGNEIGQCSQYSVESKAPNPVNLDPTKLPPPLEVKLILADWKTPVVPMPAPMEPRERRTANATIGLLVWMLGGRVEINANDILSVMEDKKVRQMKVDGIPDKFLIEVVDK